MNNDFTQTVLERHFGETLHSELLVFHANLLFPGLDIRNIVITSTNISRSV